MLDEERQRYARHIQLPTMGEAGQERLINSSVLVIGLGGLGSPAAMYLASSGIGELTLVDFDRVELSNLQRQIVHRTATVDQNKVDSAAATLHELNPHVRVRPIPTALDGDDLLAEVQRADVVVDACDNFETRFALNEACVRTGTPLVSGAAIRMEAQVAVFLPADNESPCYRCLYPETSLDGEPCSLVGVLAPMLGVIGCIQAMETIKILSGVAAPMRGRILMLDAASMEWHDLRLKRSRNCPVCSHRPWPEPEPAAG